MLSLFVVIRLSFDTKKESGYYVWKTKKTILFYCFPGWGVSFIERTNRRGGKQGNPEKRIAIYDG